MTFKIGDKVRLKKDIEPFILAVLYNLGLKMDVIYTVTGTQDDRVIALWGISWTQHIQHFELANQKSVGFIIE